MLSSSRFLGLSSIVLLALGLVPAQAVVTGASAEAAKTVVSKTLEIEGLGKGATPIDGPWQFHLGDDPAWAAPKLDDSTAKGWEQLTADKPWGAQGHASYTGYAWYRRRISLHPSPGAAPDFALYIRKIEDAYEVYWNGTLIGSNGKMPPDPKWYFAQPPQTFGLGPVREGVLAVRVWKAPLQSFDSGEQGGFNEVPVVGGPHDIAYFKESWDYAWLRRRQFTFGLNSLYGLVVLLSLLAWVRDRRQWLLFWMAGFSLGPILNFFLLSMPLGMPSAWALGLAQPVFGITDISLWFLLLWLLQLNDNRTLSRLVRVAAVIDIIVTSCDGLLSILHWDTLWMTQIQLTDAILTGIFTTLEAIPLLLVPYAVLRRRHLDPARWLVAGFAFTTEMLSVVRIASQQGSRYTHWTWSKVITAPLFIFNGCPINITTICAALLLVSIIYAVYRNLVENSRRQSAMEQEFQNARELQQVLVPETLPDLPGFALTSAYRPAQEVGGDFFQIIPLEDGSREGSTLVILGDVSGKGLKAAMAVSLIVGATRMIVDYTTSPAEILAGLNRRLYGRMQDGFATAIALRLKSDGTCVIATAGHPSPFLNQLELDLPGALPLGLTPDATYEETAMRLGVGDHFALYTDGLLEARSRSGELYGFARLETLFATSPSAAQATEAAVNFGQDDDITVLTLTRLASGQESTAVHTIPELTPA